MKGRCYMGEIKAITIEDNEEYLRQISKEVDLNDVTLKEDILILEEYCKAHEVMAMAAVQLGIPKRLVYLKNTNLDVIKKFETDTTNEEDKDYNEARVLINPVIVSREGITSYWEACASCLDNMGHVFRPYKIEVEYFDIDGNKKVDIFEGFESTVLSHEMDHLDGILHIDIADQVFKMTVDERKKFRQAHGYNIIAQKGKYEELLKNKKFSLVNRD